jgi:hypothetical protein
MRKNPMKLGTFMNSASGLFWSCTHLTSHHSGVALLNAEWIVVFDAHSGKVYGKSNYILLRKFYFKAN